MNLNPTRYELKTGFISLLYKFEISHSVQRRTLMIHRPTGSSSKKWNRVFGGLLATLLTMSTVGHSADSKTLPMVAVLPLEGRKVDSMDARTLTDALADQLLKTKAVRVMERSQMEAVLREQGFQQSGACDGQECAVKIGHLLGIDRVVVGSVASFGKAFTIAVREVDVQSGEVLLTASQNLKGDFENLLTDIIPMIANDLVHPDQVKPMVVATTEPPGQPTSSTHELQQNSTTPSEKKPMSKTSNRSGAWGWWVAGGIVLAGGTTAAILLLNDDSKAPAKNENPETSNITIRWAQ